MRSSEPARRTSDLLEDLARTHSRPRVAVADIIDALGGRGFGVLMLVLALPNAVPGPAIPGLSALFAAPLLILTAQIAVGRPEPRLPAWLLRCSMPLPRYQAALDRALPYLRRVEALLRPRPSWLLRRRGLPVLGGLLVALTLVLALPIPFANTPIALALVVIALSFLERDGRALAIGLALGVLASAWVAGLIVAGARLAETLFLLF